MELLDYWEDINDTLIFDYWFVAIFVNILGNLISSTRWCIQTNTKTNCGLAIYYTGDTICKLSYGFGPIALLLPLHSLIVVFNTLFKPKHTNNDVNKCQICGIITIFVGISLTIIFGPRSNSSYYTIDDLLYKFNESSSLFIITIMSIFVLINWIIFKFECKYLTNEFQMLTYIHISAYFASWNIVLTKCLLELIISSLISAQYASTNWTHWLTYIIIIAFILSFIGVENWKHKAIEKYHTEYVLAIYTFLLIIIGIILGSVLFDEFTYMTFFYLMLYFTAILISFIGVSVVSFMQITKINSDLRMDTFRYNYSDIVENSAKDKEGGHSIMETHSNAPKQPNINWQVIGQILMDHEFIATVEATNATLDHLEDFFEEEDILCDDFRDALCASWCSVSDEGTVLWQVLFHTLNYTKQRRLLFYDLLLHEYFTLSDMNVANLIQILHKMTRELNVSHTDFVKIKEILLNKKLNGCKFENYSNAEFEKLFRFIRNVKSSIWSLVYEEIMYWAYQEFEKGNEIDWEYIGAVLWKNNFCHDQDELNSCLDELESYFLRENIGPNILKQELCICYGLNTDKQSILRQVLFDIMHYNKQTRLALYDILLHKYIDLENLNSKQLATVLKRSVTEIDKDGVIALDKFESIVIDNKLCGSDLAAMGNAECFANMFECMSMNVNISDLFERIYEFEMSKWQTTPTEYEKSPTATLTATVTPSMKGVKMFEIADTNGKGKDPKQKQTKKKQLIQKTQLLKNRLTSPRNSKNNKNNYMKIANDCSMDGGDNNEIAEALIDIIEDVVLSQKSSYVPSKRALSQSRSRSKRRLHKKTKRRRPSTAHKIFPRKRKRKTKNISRGDTVMNVIDYDFKYIFEAGTHFKQTQLLSFIIDAFQLIRLNQFIAANNTNYDISQFIKTYVPFQNLEEYILNKYNLQRKYKKSGDFLSKTLHQYYLLFGHEISLNPTIKIKDSLPAFMSYTLCMSNAIKKYTASQLNIIHPLIIDLWIIPNKTMDFINDIGDINRILSRDKIGFIKKDCYPNNMRQTEYNIYECFCSANIRNGLKHKNTNRVICIIDRRYKDKDRLYCFIPPVKYGKLHANDMNDRLHINHTYNTSRYLLPNIGASDTCNGYMFALSFIIYKYDYQYKTKLYFYSQGGKIRFLPNQIARLWPKYFVNDKNYNSINDMDKFVKTLFTLNINDPYFEQNADLQICVGSQMQKQFILEANEVELEDKQREYIYFCEKLQEWSLYEKTFCQSNITEYNNKQATKKRYASVSSNTTPTMQMSQITPLSNRFSNNMNCFDDNGDDEKRLHPIAVEQQQQHKETFVEDGNNRLIVL